jgi:glycine/D-amino acid oxidase-like deaminating enzyme
MATAYHLLKSARQAHVRVHLDVLDPHPIGHSATGVAAGLLHPLAPSGKPLWHGMPSYAKAAAMVREASAGLSDPLAEPFWRTTGLYRPATTDKQRRQFEKNIGWSPREDLLGVRCTRGEEDSAACNGFYVPEGIILDTKRYLEALWNLCGVIAEESGSTLSSHRTKVTSLADLREYDATVIAAGAAVQEIDEFRDALELDLCQGYTVEMIHDGHASTCHDPSILGQPYVAFQGPNRAIVGATQRHGVSSAEAFRVLEHGLHDSSPDAMDAAASLVEHARMAVPALASEAWRIRSVRCGVRAIPRRTHLGSIPYAGRAPQGKNCWIIAGLGARGLVYHGLLGELTSSAVLADILHSSPPPTPFDEFPQLTRWTNRAQHPM